jgi:hypothetical protein
VQGSVETFAIGGAAALVVAGSAPGHGVVMPQYGRGRLAAQKDPDHK